jgi:DHA2 family multidrug resistance protein
MLQAGGSDPYTAAAQAKALLGKTMSQQAYIQAYNEVFYIMGALLLIAVFAVLLIRKPTGPVAHDAMVE